MNRLFLSTAIFLAILASGSAAMAVDIENADDQDYEVTIIPKDGQGSTTIVVAAGTTEEGVCDACTIKVEVVGEVEAMDGDNFEISGGRISSKSD